VKAHPEGSAGVRRARPLAAQGGAPCFVRLTDDQTPACRVFGFPPAGAGCGAFAELAGDLCADIGLWAFNAPGRQARFAEAPFTDVDRMVDEAMGGLPPLMDRPYVLFGYCSGALLAFLVARAAANDLLPAPRALVVASYPAPHLLRPAPALHTLPPAEFWTRIRSFGGFPDELADQPDYREIFEPALRADYAALAGFRYQDGPPLHVPIVAVVGRADGGMPASDARAWSVQTTAGFRLETVDGDHWLLNKPPGDLLRVVERQCRG
jgi:medium-chain acyl-[acyl-carrier-protein] hydrolase